MKIFKAATIVGMIAGSIFLSACNAEKTNEQSGLPEIHQAVKDMSNCSDLKEQVEMFEVNKKAAEDHNNQGSIDAYTSYINTTENRLQELKCE